MQFSHLLLQGVAWLKRSLAVAHTTVKNARTRKSILILTFGSFFLLYLASKYMLPAHRHFHKSYVEARPKTLSCLDIYLEKWMVAMKASDAVVKEIPQSSKENRFYSFTGNGYIGFSADGSGFKFYLLYGKDYYESTFVPIVHHVIGGGTHKKQALVLNIKEGLVHLLTTYILNKSCVAVTEVFNAHRLHKSVFQQEITISNDGVLPVSVSFNMADTGKGNRVVSRQAGDKYASTKYTIVEGHLKNDYYEADFSTGVMNFQPSVRIPQKSRNKIDVISVTKFNITKTKVKPVKRKQRKSIEQDIDTVYTKNVSAEILHISTIKAATFHKQHIDGWEDIWKVGVTIGSDYDPDSPSALHVNLTQYYLYSLVPLQIAQPPKPQPRPINQPHPVTDCFGGTPTIHNAELWVIPSTIDSLLDLKQRWLGLFQQQGCHTKQLTDFVSVRDSIVLSFLGLQYKRYHLQLALNTLNLRSNISIHDFSLHPFHSKDLLNLKVVSALKSQKHTLFVTCTGLHNPKIYGCSTACEYIVELGNTALKFPVHNTSPVTPLFYISTNRTHLEKLGKTEFMRSAKHRAKMSHHLATEPHHMKLSPKFWLAVIILIVSFHVIVIKMIYNECRKQGSGVVRRR